MLIVISDVLIGVGCLCLLFGLGGYVSVPVVYSRDVGFLMIGYVLPEGGVFLVLCVISFCRCASIDYSVIIGLPCCNCVCANSL